MNLRLDVAYDGSPFRGFARQPDVRTVQGDLEAALARLFGRQIETVGAGRTDAGVHAVGQVVSCVVPDDADPGKTRDALNAICGPWIAVSACRAVPADFNARFSARSRTYVYALFQGEVADPFLVRTTLHQPAHLDLDAMNEAAGHLIGHHDFASFGRVPEGRSSERTLYELAGMRDESVLRVRARADAFIHQMVRSLVGTLIRVGEHRMSPDDMPGILEAKDRSTAGPVAPPHGLCLVSVEYDDGWSGPGAG